MIRDRSFPRLTRFVCVVLVSAACCGCVRRRLTIRSNPPGALVYIDDQEIGRTPVSTSFIYYGTRRIRLVKDGYETTTVLERIRAPWYQIPPLDFVSENLVAREIRDERFLDFQLIPQRVVPTQEILGRANNLRFGARQGVIVPLPPVGVMGPGGDAPPQIPGTQLPVTSGPQVAPSTPYGVWQTQ